MPATSRHTPQRFLHAFALLVLAFGLLARPLAVVACDVEDARSSLAAGQIAAVGDSTAPDTGKDCCASVNCGECCAPASLVVQGMARLAAYVPVPPHALSEPPGRLQPAAYPVNSRPPIRA